MSSNLYDIVGPSLGRSPLLWKYADRSNARRAAKYDLRGSDGPQDTASKIPFQFDAQKLASSIHGGGSIELRTKAAPAYGVKPEQLMFVTGGTSQANHHVFHALLKAGDVAVVEHPVYDALAEAAKLTGAQVIAYERKKENNFQINLSEISVLLQKYSPRLFVFSNLHNPTCIAIHNQEALLELIEQHNAKRESNRETFILFDEVYRDLANPPLPCGASLSPCAISTFGLSKSYGMSGLRHGLIIARKDVVDVILGYYTLVGVCNSSLLESLWSQFYDHRERILAELRQTQEKRHKFVVDMLEEYKIPFYPSNGGTVVLVELPTANDEEFVERMIDSTDAAVNPGSWFGFPGHARVGFMTVSEEILYEGLPRFCKFYKEYVQANSKSTQ